MNYFVRVHKDQVIVFYSSKNREGMRYTLLKWLYYRFCQVFNLWLYHDFTSFSFSLAHDFSDSIVLGRVQCF